MQDAVTYGRAAIAKAESLTKDKPDEPKYEAFISRSRGYILQITAPAVVFDPLTGTSGRAGGKAPVVARFTNHVLVTNNPDVIKGVRKAEAFNKTLFSAKEFVKSSLADNVDALANQVLASAKYDKDAISRVVKILTAGKTTSGVVEMPKGGTKSEK
jgi:hypothetical protein